MSEEKSGGKVHLVLAALAGLGLLIAKNADSCFKAGAKVADDVAGAGTKSDGLIDGASTAARTGDRTVPTGRLIGADTSLEERIDIAQEAGRILVEAGAAESAELAEQVALLMEDDASLPEEEWGVHEDDPHIPLAGMWCHLEAHGDRAVAFTTAIDKPADGGSIHRGIRAAGPPQTVKTDATEVVEIEWEGARFCIRTAPLESPEELAETTPTCHRLIRLTNEHLTIQATGIDSWVRCDP